MTTKIEAVNIRRGKIEKDDQVESIMISSGRAIKVTYLGK